MRLRSGADPSAWRQLPGGPWVSACGRTKVLWHRRHRSGSFDRSHRSRRHAAFTAFMEFVTMARLHGARACPGGRPMNRGKLTGERSHSRSSRARAALFVGVALLALLVGPRGSWGDEDQPKPTAMERLFPSLKEDMKDLPAFLRDTDFTIYLRELLPEPREPGRHGERSLGLRRLGRLPLRMALRRVPDRGHRLRLRPPLRARRQGRHDTAEVGAGGLRGPGRGVRRAPVQGIRGRERLPAGGLSGLHQPPGQPDDAQHLRGSDPRREAGPGGVPRRLPLGHQAPERRRIPVHVGESGGGG